MSDYLVQQALQSVWCSPMQDRQNIIALAKISRYGGVYSSISVMWREYNLPELGKLYHIYQVGNISPRHLGLTIPGRAGLWMRLIDVCAKESTIVDLYNVNGIQSPRFAAWYTVTEDNNLILAVEDNPKLAINYSEETLYMRTYSNAYYDSVRHDSSVDYIKIQGMIVRTPDEILTMQHLYEDSVAIGSTYAFVNGMLVDKIDMLNVGLGDAVEFVYDGSIYAMEDMKVSDLFQFDSELDLKRKYLLHSSRAIKSNITYHDDIDVWLTHPTGNANRWHGIYFHRNQGDAIRQVTHVDYSISIPYMNSYANSQPNWQFINDMTVRIHWRKSGFRRPLVNEAHRVRELYKLPNNDVVAAMVGVDATVPEWQAANLEKSAYVKVMGALAPEITPALVQQAFGYNSMSQYLAPTPQFTQNVSGQALVNIPPNLRFHSTVYEYDFDGHLLGWYQHALGDVWRAVNTDTHLVEIITGFGVTRLDERYGQQAATLDANLDYRMYTCQVNSGVPDNNWVDVTGSSKYVVNGNGLTWLSNPYTTYTMVRSNRDFLAYDINIPIQSGVLRFSLASEQNRNGTWASTLMQVQMGELDLWLNGRALVEGVDYIVRFPDIVIINKKFIDLSKEQQKVTVRFCGHCKADLSRAVLGDRGFVQHGVLSNNNRFDIRDDKVLHINVGGAVYDRSELTFAEGHSGVNVPGVPNGTPYVVRDIVIPLRGTVNAKTYDLRDVALVTDKHVSDYMTLKLPPPKFTEISSIPELYPVYSPFCSALIDDLASGLLKDSRMTGTYNDNIIREMCKFYEPLLAYEPSREPNAVDPNYVSVQPYYKDTVTTLNLYQHRFLSRAINLYLNGAVELSHFVMVTA